MNTLEHKMVDILKNLRDNHAVVGVKAEFEAEGTRIEEAIRLKEIVSRAGLGLTIKIGGCEALRDIYECRTIGVNRIVSPMIESAFALKKFLAAVRKAVPHDERRDLFVAINIETTTGYDNLDSMLALPNIEELNGIVVGRTDLSGSLGMKSDEVNDSRIFDIAEDIFVKSKGLHLETGVGGGVSAYSLPFFRRLPSGTLDRYETRKVIFDCAKALNLRPEDGILKAVGFEILWLKNKRDYYGAVSSEDDKRIGELENRYKHKIEEAGGLS